MIFAAKSESKGTKECSPIYDEILSPTRGMRQNGCVYPRQSGEGRMRVILIKRFCSMGTLLLLLPIAAGSLAAQVTSQPAATAGATSNAAQTTAPADPKVPAAASANYAGPMDANRYVIGPEDSLQITVWKEPTLSGTIPVRPDGMISLVLVGDIPAAGMTPTALSTDISQRLKKYIQDPVVTVVVLGVNSQRVFLVGEVGKVGPVVMTPGMTPLQAIVTGGGIKIGRASCRERVC